jgi:hypothetical protein
VAVGVGGTAVVVTVGEDVLVGVDGTGVTVTVGIAGVAVAVPVGRPVNIGVCVEAGLWDGTTSSVPGLESVGNDVPPTEQAVKTTAPTT